MAVITKDTAPKAKHAAPEHGLVYRIVDPASFDCETSDLDDVRLAQSVPYVGQHRAPEQTSGSQLRVKHSTGLGGWVVYDGSDFVGGTFATREQAELWATVRAAS